MKVELLNKEEVKNFYKTWGTFASVCYDSKNSDPEKIGKFCMKNGHTSGSRAFYFIFKISGVTRASVDQLVRAEVGVVKNVRSFRYVDEDGFDYSIPVDIENKPELLEKYKKHMEATQKLYEEIQAAEIADGKSKSRANEQARYVLPMATHSEFCFGLTYEALVHLCNIRLCVRTEDQTRKIAVAIKQAVVEVLPEMDTKLVPNCQKLLYCPESKRESCNAYPQREDVVSFIEIGKAIRNREDFYKEFESVYTGMWASENGK